MPSVFCRWIYPTLHCNARVNKGEVMTKERKVVDLRLQCAIFEGGAECI